MTNYYTPILYATLSDDPNFRNSDYCNNLPDDIYAEFFKMALAETNKI